MEITPTSARKAKVLFIIRPSTAEKGRRTALWVNRFLHRLMLLAFLLQFRLGEKGK